MDPMMIIAIAILIGVLYLTWRLWFPLLLFIAVLCGGILMGSLILVSLGIAAIADFVILRWRKIKRKFKK